MVHGIFDPGGSLVQYISFVTDITSRKAAERERRDFEVRMRQAQKMEAIGTRPEASPTISQFLSAIMGYSEMGLIESGEGSHLQRYLEQVLKATARAADLVKQILTFSRQSDEALKPVMIGPIIKEAVKFLRASIPATIEIRLRTAADPQAMILGDPTQIHQVVMNLCTNAAHAMRKRGGTLEVELTEADLGGTRAGVLSLRNSNPGAIFASR